MVCLGNICRSPVAHGVFDHLCKENGLDWEIDSAGTSGWHDGESPDRRSIESARKNGIDISRQISRRVTQQDLDYFDYIFVMDKSNLQNVMKIANENQAQKIHLFLEYGDSKDPIEVPDPYYTHGFDYVFDLIKNASEVIIGKINDSRDRSHN